jgi:hypothetical protein
MGRWKLAQEHLLKRLRALPALVGLPRPAVQMPGPLNIRILQRIGPATQLPRARFRQQFQIPLSGLRSDVAI